MSQAQVDHYIQQIEQQTQSPGGRHDLTALRAFLEADDGRPFYTVNLYRFYDEAQYEAPLNPGGDGRTAYDRFSAKMVRLLIARGSHPIYGSNLVLESHNKWDRIVIVRYRSRRDIADLFASVDFAEASAHKWAALAANERLLVQGRQIPDGRYVFAFIALFAALLGYGLTALTAPAARTGL